PGRKALLLMTDGTATMAITQVPQNKTYVVGVDVTAGVTLGNIAGAATTAGQVLLTSLAGGHDQLEVQKLVSNIVAEAADWAIIEDPDGELTERNPAYEHRFRVSAAETRLFVLLLTPWPKRVRVEFMGPGGRHISVEDKEIYAGRAGAIVYRIPIL